MLGAGIGDSMRTGEGEFSGVKNQSADLVQRNMGADRIETVHFHPQSPLEHSSPFHSTTNGQKKSS